MAVYKKCAGCKKEFLRDELYETRDLNGIIKNLCKECAEKLHYRTLEKIRKECKWDQIKGQ